MDGQRRDDAIAFTLNGHAVSAEAFPGQRLSALLRDNLGARDVKLGCNAGDCGSCSVLIDGALACACLVPAHQAAGCRVETVSGLVADDPKAKALAERFQDHGAAQCGICTPGLMVSAVALLRRVDRPTEAEVRDALGGVLCRCTGYRKIIEAVMDAPGACVSQVPSGTAIGASLRRLDGQAKVSGAEAFGDDVAPPGTLEVRVIRSPHAHARFTLGDLSQWCDDTPGIEAVLSAADVPGRNCFGVIPDFADQPLFAEGETRFRGEAVAAIVGAPEALRTLRDGDLPITWDPLASVADPTAARSPDAPQLHAGRDGNVMCGGLVQTGDAVAALAAADVTVEAQFTTAFVEHAYIEPEAGFARMVDGRVEIQCCTQAPAMNREGVAGLLGLDPQQVHILPTSVGGGFGSKLDLSVQPFLALATFRTGKPVRMAYSRSESMQSTTKRHPAEITMKIGARRDGRLSGVTFDGTFNTGAYASWGPTVANRVPVHASGPYLVRDYRAQAHGVHTHCPPSGAFRGFGVPQSAIAQEQLFDMLAAKLGMDALEFRLLNALDNDLPTVCGQRFAQGVGIRACLEALRPAWQEARDAASAFNAQANGALRRGVGLAAGWYGCGNTSLPNPSTIRAGVRADGTVVLHQGAMDIGQGSNTVISQIFADALGVAPDQLHLVGADTDLTPDAGKTSASRQTFVSGNAARLSGEALRAAILRHVNAPTEAQLFFGSGCIRAIHGEREHVIDLSTLPQDDARYVFEAVETYDPPTQPLDANGQGAPYAQFGYAAQLAVVEVDTDLGTTRPLRFVAAHDVGRAINPKLVEGQVEGGIAQGLGMALMEEYLPGRTENLHDYLIPTIGDMPPVDTLIVEVPDAHGPSGAKGLGEHVLIPTAPALLNAIANAADVRMTQVPVTPSRLRAAIKARTEKH